MLVEAGNPYFVTEPPAAHLRLTFADANLEQMLEGTRRLGSVM